MPLKTYSLKYRRLKQVYERQLGKKVSDVTWGRVVSTLKQIFGFKVESENAEKLGVSQLCKNKRSKIIREYFSRIT
ncbi:MAG: hypothetical protein AAF915_24245 [Cyanobacteria bacterium P01_D01_bin.50]